LVAVAVIGCSLPGSVSVLTTSILERTHPEAQRTRTTTT
jgi:hypothetical protein